MSIKKEADSNTTRAEQPLPHLDPALERVLARIRLLAQRRKAWLHTLWSRARHSGAEGSGAYTAIEDYLNNSDAPESEAEWIATDPGVQQWNRDIAAIEEQMNDDVRSRFALLHQIFGLNREESDLFQACLGAGINPNLQRVFAYLQDHAGRAYVTEELVARLFGHGRCLLMSAESPLKVWDLITEHPGGQGEPSFFTCDPYIRNWLLGINDLDRLLVGIATIQIPHEPLENWPVEETVSFISAMVSREVQQRVRIHITGQPGSGRRTLAACICKKLNMPLLVIDGDRITPEEWQHVFIHAQRQAYLERCAIAWYGESTALRFWPQIIPGFHVQFVISEDYQVPPIPDIVDHVIEIPPISIEERRSLWKRLVPVSAVWPEKEFDELVRRHQVHIGQIAALARKATSCISDASTTLREATRHRLTSLAQLLECPFKWDDLVIPEWLLHNLEDFLYEARERGTLWEQGEIRRLFPQGRGLMALFTGVPGTGKTMAAQVIAADIGLDLFRIDLSSVVSKYVGETSKNLERILSRAARMNAVLLFDEADALFGKRTDIKDAHDRFANTDTNYLLQAIENYPGIAILASNKMANIDQGFIRRLRYVLEFPKPDLRQRSRIWSNLIGELAGHKRVQDLGGDIHRLAENLELTGAQIKLSVLSALFAARRDNTQLSMKHLLRGVERELVKEGQVLSRHVQTILLGQGT